MRALTLTMRVMSRTGVVGVVVGPRVRVVKVEVESENHTGARVRIEVVFLRASAEDKRVRIMIRGGGVVRVLVAKERGSAPMMRLGM